MSCIVTTGGDVVGGAQGKEEEEEEEEERTKLPRLSQSLPKTSQFCTALRKVE
jgi:hypothetical protein